MAVQEIEKAGRQEVIEALLEVCKPHGHQPVGDIAAVGVDIRGKQWGGQRLTAFVRLCLFGAVELLLGARRHLAEIESLSVDRDLSPSAATSLLKLRVPYDTPVLSYAVRSGLVTPHSGILSFWYCYGDGWMDGRLSRMATGTRWVADVCLRGAEINGTKHAHSHTHTHSETRKCCRT